MPADASSAADASVEAPQAPPVIAVLLKTSPGRRSLRWVLEALALQFAPGQYRLYLHDEAPLDAWKEPVYADLRRQGHVIELGEGPVSVNVARNRMVAQMQDEPFVLRIDDDHEMAGEFSIAPMLSLLEHPEIDFCSCPERIIGNKTVTRSGVARIRAGFIHFASGRYRPEIELLDDDSWPYETHNGVRYARAEYMRNLILLKRHCLDTVAWNEDLMFELEHEDFYFSLKRAGLRGAFTPDVVFLHREDLKQLCVDMAAESAWRGNRAGEMWTQTRKVFDATWGGMPLVLKRRAWPIRQLRRLKRTLRP